MASPIFDTNIGGATINSNVTVISGSITTAAAKEVVILAVATSVGVSSITDTAGLNWQRRASISSPSGGAPDGMILEYWWAPSAAILTSDSFTIFLNGTTFDGAVWAQVAIQGCADYTKPFDPHPSEPGSVIFSGSAAADAPQTTTFSNVLAMVIMGCFGGPGTPSVGSPFTQLTFESLLYTLSISYYIPNKQLTNQQVAVGGPGGTGSNMAIISDAFYSPGPLRALPVTCGF